MLTITIPTCHSTNFAGGAIHLHDPSAAGRSGVHLGPSERRTSDPNDVDRTHPRRNEIEFNYNRQPSRGAQGFGQALTHPDHRLSDNGWLLGSPTATEPRRDHHPLRPVDGESGMD